jgi:two-component system, LytTR family, response regulator AlgR
MTLRAVVVDDEAPARARLRSLLEELPDIEVTGEAGDGTGALALCTRERPDVAFVDIRMPGMDGLTLARALAGLEPPPAVIFTTAYDSHAIEAFDARAIAYLLKPVRREKLEQAVRHARRFTVVAEDDTAAPGYGEPRQHVAVRGRDGLRLVRIEDVHCFVAEQKYTTVHHAGGEDVIEDSLRTLELSFGARVLRIHRNTLVATHRVLALSRGEEGQYTMTIDGLAAPLSVSRRLVTEIKARLEA